MGDAVENIQLFPFVEAYTVSDLRYLSWVISKTGDYLIPD